MGEWHARDEIDRMIRDALEEQEKRRELDSFDIPDDVCEHLLPLATELRTTRCGGITRAGRQDSCATSTWTRWSGCILTWSGSPYSAEGREIRPRW